VEDGLAGVGVAVEDGPVATRIVAMVPGNRRRSPHHLTHQRVVFLRQVVQRGDVPPGYDEDVCRRLRVDIFERDQPIVLVHDRRGYLFRHDLAEKAVHPRTPRDQTVRCDSR
jgi:hypothetical protein